VSRRSARPAPRAKSASSLTSGSASLPRRHLRTSRLPSRARTTGFRFFLDGDVRVGIVAHVLLNAADLVVLLGYLYTR
jgi:hypothetical protein